MNKENEATYLFDLYIKIIKKHTNKVFKNTTDIKNVRKLLSDIRIIFEYTKSKRVLGKADTNLKLITLYLDNIKQDIDEVIIHEIMHIIANTIYCRDIGHSKLFKNLIECYGYDKNLGKYKKSKDREYNYIWDIK